MVHIPHFLLYNFKSSKSFTNNMSSPSQRSYPFHILLLLPLFLSISFSHGASHQRVLESNVENEPSWVARLVTNTSNSNATFLVLAANRTHRRDPSDGFKFYTGGWDITNPHYLYSVAFSAAPAFVIAAVWFLLFGICLICFCIRRCFCCCCKRKETNGYSQATYVLSLIFLLLLLAAALAGSAALYTGQEKFHSSTVSIVSYVLHTADTTVQTLQDVFNYLVAAKKIGVGQFTLPADTQADIDRTQSTINSVAAHIHTVTGKSSKDIQSFLNRMRIYLIYVAAALLLLAFLGFILSVLGLQCLVSILVIIGWILIAATFILSGIFLLIHNSVADTCVAMDEWVQNPTANSTLENILPRVDNATAQSIFSVTKGVTFYLVNVVNFAINVSNADVPPSTGPPLYFNQSGPLVPVLCNPYNSDFIDQPCEPGEVDFKNATEVWKNYVCQISESSGNCVTLGRITPNGYNQMAASVNISYGLYRYTPFLIDLVDSTFVKETFGNISTNHCPGLIQSSQDTYVGFLTSSAAVMLSLVLWFVYGRERRHRLNTKKYMTID